MTMVQLIWSILHGDTMNNGGNVDEGEVERRMREGSE